MGRVANLTITVDAEVLKRARIKAIENDESVNAYLARKLKEYVGEIDQSEARRRILDHAERSTAGSGPDGRTWTREELYDR